MDTSDFIFALIVGAIVLPVFFTAVAYAMADLTEDA